jgi:hypothetical protein
MHLDGLIRREKKPIRVQHIAEIMSAALAHQNYPQGTGR